MLRKSFIFIVALFFTGCAGLPQTVPLPDEQEDAVRQSFKEMVSAQRQCWRSLDVSVSVSFKSLLFSGALDGYLQAMAPGHIKFVGVSPLGQPLVIFTTDGAGFQFIEIPAAKAVSGPVTSKVFKKYAPVGLNIDFSYYWIIGRLPPGKVKIMTISRPEEGDGFWVDLCCGPENTRRKLLFDPLKKIIKRHILLNDKGEALLDVRYGQFTGAACALPGRMVIKSSKHNGELTVVMADWNLAADFKATDFAVLPPPGFKRVVVDGPLAD